MLNQLRRGATWTYGSIVAGAIVQVGITAATARLIDPTAFGLVAMANAVLHFGSYFSRMGVRRALIQRSEVADVDVRAAFTLSVLLGTVVAGAMYLLAPVATLFFRTEGLTPVMRWLALTFLLTGVGETAHGLLERNLQFRASGVVNVVSHAIGYGIPAVVMAALGFGVWSLVAGAIGQRAVSAAILFGLTRHPVRPTADVRAHRSLLRFGAAVSGISVLEYFGATVDSLFVGRYGSAAALGVYNRAYTLANLPTYRISQGLAKVLFPVLSAGRTDHEGFREALARVTVIVGKLVLPVGVGMAVAAPELVAVLLGDQWHEASPVLSFLAIAMSMNVLATFPGIALESLNVLRGKAIVQAAYAATLVAVLGILLAAGPLELVHVAIVMTVANVVRVGTYFGLGVRAGALRGTDVARIVAAFAASSAVALVAIGGVTVLARQAGGGDVVTLLAAIGAGAVVLALLFRSEIWNLLRPAH